MALPQHGFRRPSVPRISQKLALRPRLGETLDQVFDTGIARVSAGAGYGKTALVSSWVSQLETIPIAWVTCRDDHNDSRRLADDLADAVGGFTEIPTGRLMQDAAAALPVGAPLLIVFDDVHQLTERAAIEDFVDFLDLRPETVFIVVSSRSQSTIPWHRFAARGQVVEIRGRELAFTPEEATELFSATFGLDLTPDVVEDLCAASEGWAAGLCLAGHALRDSPGDRVIDASDLARHRFVRDFLDREVLPGLPVDLVRFLEDTSLLTRLDPELCNRLTDRVDSIEVLHGFVERNLFTEEVESTPDVFRYHALFREWLRARTNRRGPDHAASLLLAASRWYEARGDSILAIDAAARSGDRKQVEDVIRSAAGPALRAGFAATVLRWMAMLPPESLQHQPDLSLLLSRAAGASGDLLLARAGIASVGRLVEDPSTDVAPSIRLEHLELSAVISLWIGDIAGARDQLEEALAFLATHPADSGYALYGLDRSHFEVLIGVVRLMSGDLDGAVDVADELLEPGRLTDPAQDRDTVLALGLRSLALAWQAGREDEAREHVEACRSKVLTFRGTTGGPFSFSVAGVWCGDEERAAADLGTARSIALEVGLPLYLAVYWLAEAKHALRRVQRNRAESALSEADTVLATMPNATFLAAIARGLRTELTESASADPGLTDRELMILRGLADGESRREVAERSYLSLNTIKTHLRTAYRKLGATSREEAIERARTLGLLGSPGGDEQPPLR